MRSSASAIEKPVAIGALYSAHDHSVGHQDADEGIARHAFRVAHEKESDLIARMENSFGLTMRELPVVAPERY